MAKVFSINEITLPKLESGIYGLKRRANLLSLIIDEKLESKISNNWRDTYTVIYNCLSKIETLQFLISEKKFPKSHYNIKAPKRISFKFVEKKFAGIVEQKNALYSNLHEFKKAEEIDSSLKALIRPELCWNDWLEVWDMINYEIDDTKGIFSL